MPVLEATLSAIAGAVFNYVIQETNVGDQVRQALGREPKRLAFQRALRTAIEGLEHEYSGWVASLFDGSFLEREGAPILAQLLIRDGRPDPSELAVRWADSLNVQQTERRTALTREVEPVAAYFLDSLADALLAEPDLQDLNNSRALEQLNSNVQAIALRIGAGKATLGTQRDYLRWLIDRNLYVDPRGILQTQRQVQVRLEDVYISLRAKRDEADDVNSHTLLEQEIAKIEEEAANSGLSVAEVEDLKEQLLRRANKYDSKLYSKESSEVVELAEAVERNDRVVILGDPGSGKSTLLRYLALRSAQGLWESGSDIENGLGQARLPILIRVADYAENGAWREQPLTDFLTSACAVHECPRSGLADLFETALAHGNCLVLLDGLDEIVSADDRRGVVRKIEDFVRRHSDRPNRFVVTSRVAGYRNAPLGGPFAHYIVQEMDDSQISSFLEVWCPAVEAAQTPELSLTIRTARARQEIDSILRAVQTTRGVRALAANPLLLTTLALIHRTGAQLPQKRIGLYKIATDTLARTWRIASGVPESALVREEYLTRLLGRFAYWLHDTKDTGIATEREVYEVLGREWAHINRQDWDPDDQDPAILSEVRGFLERVQVHTGLFVERSPGRYGFMHLTFEEYYAARNLIARPTKAPELIRNKLHNPRWEEPILLALGFVGLDYPEQAIDLMELSVFGRGEAGDDSTNIPSAFENILGRDYFSPCAVWVMKSPLTHYQKMN